MRQRTGVFAAVSAVLVLSAATAFGSRLLAQPGVQVAVSREPGPQSETAIAIDPNNSEILLAGSNNERKPFHALAYSSTDGGATWQTNAPRPQVAALVSADPIVAIDRAGRQYFGFVSVRVQFGVEVVDVFLSSREGPAGRWRTTVVSRGTGYHDKPALAVDTWPASPRPNRVYLAWSRILADRRAVIVIAHSDDGGATWSNAVRVDDRPPKPTFNSYPSVAVAPDGTVYVAWWNAFGKGVFLDRSTDGGASFGRDVLVDPIAGHARCSPPGVKIPAQPTNCVRPNPTVSVDGTPGPLAGHVYVTYGDAGPSAQQDVFTAAFDSSLKPLLHRRLVAPPGAPYRTDQFWPASAVDQATGRLWLCFYDTTGDRRRKRTYFSCTYSTDGGLAWAPVIRAASVPSNATVRGADTGHRAAFGREYGDYEGLAVQNGVAHPIWTDTRDLGRLKEEIYTTALTEASFALSR